jgi:hypothetical protein
MFGVQRVRTDSIWQVVAGRIDPRIDRIVAPTVGNYSYHDWQTDESARFKDKFRIESLMDVMKAYVQQTDEQHCALSVGTEGLDLAMQSGTSFTAFLVA